MAVYKPSNCVPFLSCWDLTQPQYISGELNTSNETVTGYKVRVLDSENNTIFEGSEFSPFPENIIDNRGRRYSNTGLNGSEFIVPAIKNIEERPNIMRQILPAVKQGKSETGWWEINKGITFTNHDGWMSKSAGVWLVNGTTNTVDSFAYCNVQENILLTEGHIYYVPKQIKSYGAVKIYIEFKIQDKNGKWRWVTTTKAQSGDRASIGILVEFSKTEEVSISRNGLTPMLFDLTEMYQSGNEPVKYDEAGNLIVDSGKFWGEFTTQLLFPSFGEKTIYKLNIKTAKDGTMVANGTPDNDVSYEYAANFDLIKEHKYLFNPRIQSGFNQSDSKKITFQIWNVCDGPKGVDSELIYEGVNGAIFNNENNAVIISAPSVRLLVKFKKGVSVNNFVARPILIDLTELGLDKAITNPYNIKDGNYPHFFEYYLKNKDNVFKSDNLSQQTPGVDEAKTWFDGTQVLAKRSKTNSWCGTRKTLKELCPDLMQGDYLTIDFCNQGDDPRSSKVYLLYSKGGGRLLSIGETVIVTEEDLRGEVGFYSFLDETKIAKISDIRFVKTSSRSISQDNIIYYDSKTNGFYSWNGGLVYKIENFSNNYPDQPYKWQITLAQGQQNIDGVLEQQPADEYFDMVIDEAKILGSTGNRIQSWLSENIYKDYYIQLYAADTEDANKVGDQLGVRTRISSYDHSYGFIYPQENTIPQELVDKASYFKIFKDTNDPQYVSTARLVNYRLKTDIDKVELDEKTPSSGFTPQGEVATVTNPYFTQIYDGDVTKYITYERYGGASTSPLAQGTTVLLMYQGDTNASPKPTYNVNNGVFAFQSAEFKDGKTTIKWLRPANFNKYSDFLNRLICVQSENKNYSTSATAENLGTINQTELMFYDEAAIGLYPVYEDGTKTLKVAEVELPNSEIGKPQNFDGGIISSVKVKTQPTGVTLTAICLGGNKYVVKASDTYTGTATVNITYMEDKGEVFKNAAGKAYIRPFIGIHAGDKLFYGKDFASSVTIDYIDDVGNSKNKFSPTWYIEYNSAEKKLDLDDKYSIRSFFKTSDENPFYAKASPVLTIDCDQWEKDSEDKYFKNEYGYCVCKRRYVTFKGTITNRNWVNYQWVLTDLTTNNTQISEKIYRGSTECTFYGLQNDHYYEISWIVEDEFGGIFTCEQVFFLDVSINDSPFPFEAEYECETQSVLINFARDGVIIPDPALYSYDTFMVRVEEGSNIYQPYVVKGEKNLKYTYRVLAENNFDPDTADYTIEYVNTDTDNGYLQLGDIQTETPSPDLTYLMSYTMTQIGDSESATGEIPAPTSDDFALNSQHVLNANFVGDVITYEIDIEDFNDLPAHIGLAVELLPSSKTNAEGEVEAEENRNKIKLNCYKKINNGAPLNKYEIFFNIFKKDSDGKWVKDESGRWQEENPVVSAWIPDKDYTVKDNRDYIPTTHPYVWDGAKQVPDNNYLNITGEGALNSSSSVIVNPLGITDSTAKKDRKRVWYDRKTELVQQTAEGDQINAFKAGEDGYWKWPSENEGSFTWEDEEGTEPSTIYSQTELVGHTGRQNVVNYKMTFNIVIKNYKTLSANKDIVWQESVIANAFIEKI